MTDKFACPSCGEFVSRVINSRPTATGYKRRRECLRCHCRFTTDESIRHDSIVHPPKNFRPYNI